MVNRDAPLKLETVKHNIFNYFYVARMQYLMFLILPWQRSMQVFSLYRPSCVQSISQKNWYDGNVHIYFVYIPNKRSSHRILALSLWYPFNTSKRPDLVQCTSVKWMMNRDIQWGSLRLLIPKRDITTKILWNIFKSVLEFLFFLLLPLDIYIIESLTTHRLTKLFWCSHIINQRTLFMTISVTI